MALLVNRGPERRAHRIMAIRTVGGDQLADAVSALARRCEVLRPVASLPLMEEAAPLLREELRINPNGPLRAFWIIDAFNGPADEFDPLKAIAEMLATGSGDTTRLWGGVQLRRSQSVTPAIAVILEAVARAGGGDEATRASADEAATALVEAHVGQELQPVSAGTQIDEEAVREALESIAGAPEPIRRCVAEACFACAAHSGTVAASQSEWLRAVGLAIRVDLPRLGNVRPPFQPG